MLYLRRSQESNKHHGKNPISSLPKHNAKNKPSRWSNRKGGCFCWIAAATTAVAVLLILPHSMFWERNWLSSNEQNEHSFASSLVVDCISAKQEEEGHSYFTSLFSLSNNLSMATHNPKEDCPISYDIHQDGCYECHVLSPLLRSAPNATAILDIGANIGLYGLSAAALGLDVYQVEPSRHNQERICATVRRNQGLTWFGNVKLFAAAAVDHTMFEQSKLLQLEGTNNLNKGGIKVGGDYADNPGSIEGIHYARTVPISILKQHLPPAGSTIILKVDVEGNECHALAGAMEYLKTIRVAYCAIEWSQERLKACQNRQEIFDLFIANGLTPYQAELNKTTHPIGWKKLDVDHWQEWIWKAPNRKRPERTLFDVAWSRTVPHLEGPIRPKINSRCAK